MVGISTHFNYMTFEVVAEATEVTMEFCFYGRINKVFSVLRAEDDVNVVFYE